MSWRWLFWLWLVVALWMLAAFVMSAKNNRPK